MCIVIYKPEFSHRNPLNANSLQVLILFCTTELYFAKKSRHVVDIAILYPIQSLPGDHYLDGPIDTYSGVVDIPHTDYVDVSSWLTNYVGKEFTFIHPEVVDEKCTVIDGVLNFAEQNKLGRIQDNGISFLQNYLSK